MLSNMVVFNDDLRTATMETLGQQIEQFNGASNGALMLSSEGFRGDFFEESFVNALYSAQRRVNMYGANSAATPTDYSEDQLNGVKVAGGFGPIRMEPAQFQWMQTNEDEAIANISLAMSTAILQDELNTAIACLVAAIENQGASTVVDVSGGSQIDQSALNASHALFGDKSKLLTTQIMTGVQYHNLIGQNLTNATQLFQAEGVLVTDILGKISVITDAPALTATGKQKVLSLTSGSARISDGGGFTSNVDVRNGNQRIEATMQADYNFMAKLKGYSWDEVNGGKSPDDATLATGSNWDLAYDEIKNTAGVLTIGDTA